MTSNNEGGIRLSGTNLERAADHNQRITLHAIRVAGSLTRVDLANITGLLDTLGLKLIGNFLKWNP